MATKQLCLSSVSICYVSSCVSGCPPVQWIQTPAYRKPTPDPVTIKKTCPFSLHSIQHFQDLTVHLLSNISHPFTGATVMRSPMFFTSPVSGLNADLGMRVLIKLVYLAIAWQIVYHYMGSLNEWRSQYCRYLLPAEKLINVTSDSVPVYFDWSQADQSVTPVFLTAFPNCILSVKSECALASWLY